MVKRFFRNTLSVVGLCIIIVMFLFSFVGGLISPYEEDEIFYTYTDMKKNYVSATKNDVFRYQAADGQSFSSAQQAKFLMAYGQKKDVFEYQGVTYLTEELGEDFYSISADGTELAIAYKDIVNAADDTSPVPYAFKRAALVAYCNHEDRFSLDGKTYRVTEDGDVREGKENVAYISRFIVQAAEPGLNITRAFKEKLETALDNGDEEFRYTDQSGEEAVYALEYRPDSKTWNVLQDKSTYVKDTYGQPSKAHPLGTDGNGMDMLTRLMYGGRVSLVIGFIVVWCKDTGNDVEYFVNRTF